MLHFYKEAPNASAQELIKADLAKHTDAVRVLLPELPSHINIWLTDHYVIPETGCGGFAYAPDIITIGYDQTFADKSLQSQSLKGTVFHESYHLVQGHTAIDAKAHYSSLLDSAVYEGCATVFEREHANSNPLWGEYTQHSSEQLAQWRDGMAAIPYNGDHDTITDISDSWAFFDNTDNQRWKLYKTGVWIVDKALQNTGKTILDLRSLSAQQILDLAK